MTEKKLWSIDRFYWDRQMKCDGSFYSELQCDPIDTIEATEEEIKNFLYADWNPPTIRYGDHIYRQIEATELKLRTVSDLKGLLIDLDIYPVKETEEAQI